MTEKKGWQTEGELGWKYSCKLVVLQVLSWVTVKLGRPDDVSVRPSREPRAG